MIFRNVDSLETKSIKRNKNSLPTGKQERNNNIDIMRGILVILVCFLHVVDHICIDAKDTIIYNAIWSIQMPAFFMISGYVNKYSAQKSLLKFFTTRTKSYLLPWGIWTLLVKGVLFQQSNMYNPKYILWHMDSGYWFLFTLWVISIAFAVSKHMAYRLCKDKCRPSYLAMFSILYIVILVLYAIIAVIFGITFLGMKYTLYYMVFYYVGYIYGEFENKMTIHKSWKKLKEYGVAFATIVFMYFISRYNFATIQDSFDGIILRAIVSLAGCTTFFALICINGACKIGSVLTWIGKSTLEVYVIHLLIIEYIVVNEKIELMSCFGLASVIFVTGTVLLITCVITVIIHNNRVLKRIFVGK